MKTRAIVAVAAVILLLGAAVLAQDWLFSEGDGTEVADARTAAAATADLPTGAPDAPGTVGAALNHPSVLEVSGVVERKAKGGDWAPLRAGDILAEEDEIRTAAGARALLKIDDGRIEVFERDTLGVSEITAAAAELLLHKGRIAAIVPDSKGEPGAAPSRALRIRADGSDAVVETKGGRFAVYADGAGAVAVAAETGGVKLSAGGKTIELDPATIARVSPGAAPVIGPVAEKVVLEVRWPGDRTLAKKETVVAGKTEPGTRVLVGDEEIAVGADGTFRATVPLAEGVSRVKVEVEDVTGKKGVATSPKFTVDTISPAAKAHAEDLWKKKKKE